ncbi:AbrB/MazE/SpoVT family DNA-binding domain-containing protein [Paenibacillus sp. FSL R5-0407]|uniref:AbrB/MazE/SpoVT family DNA-binding domain-containing protein n=1 Tax=Paenibacillus sp. FSL R5-0407 TaxID=2975320 RepID=UPI0030FA5341
MKSTGIVRRIDDLGRVVIPKELRRTLGIAEADPLEIFVDGERIIFRKYQPGCSICGSVDKILREYYGKPICIECISQIADLLPK